MRTTKALSMQLVAALTLLVGVACGTPPSGARAPDGEPIAPGAAAAQAASDSALVTALRARLSSAAQSDEFSGAVLVTRDGRTLFEDAYGLADRERGVPNTPRTQFRVGSMNKMLTAVAALQLVQAGALRLDAPLGTYLPDYPSAEVASKVTPHHLLTHTGGTGDIFGPQFMANRTELRTTGITSGSTARAACSSRRGRSMCTATTASCSSAPSSSGWAGRATTTTSRRACSRRRG
jgi:CubicO group peptidase (beta-lactamase class C family)